MRGVLSSNYAKDIQMEKHHYNQGTFITMADMHVQMNILLQSYLRLHAQSLALTWKMARLYSASLGSLAERNTAVFHLGLCGNFMIRLRKTVVGLEALLLLLKMSLRKRGGQA